jgi:hypothetical protein
MIEMAMLRRLRGGHRRGGVGRKAQELLGPFGKGRALVNDYARFSSGRSNGLSPQLVASTAAADTGSATI